MSLALVRFRFLSSGDFISDISVKVDIKIRLNKLKLKIIQRLCLCYIKVVADDLSFFLWLELWNRDQALVYSICHLTEDLGRSLPAKGLLPQNSSVNSQKISRRSFTLLGSPLAMASPVMWSKGTPKTSSSRVLIRNWQTLASCRWFRVSRQPVEQTSLSAPPPTFKTTSHFP